MKNDYNCWGERELIERIRFLEEKHRDLLTWLERERVAQGTDSDGHPTDWYIDYDDLLSFLNYE